MYTNALLVTLLGSLSFIQALALPAPRIEARAFPTDCTNYPGYVAGTHVGAPKSAAPTTYPKNADVQWCKSDTSYHVEFVSPPSQMLISGSLSTTESAFATLFDDSSATLSGRSGGTGVPNNFKIYASGPLSLTAQPVSGFTYAEALAGMQIIQNYLYLSRNYGNIYGVVYVGSTQVGILALDFS